MHWVLKGLEIRASYLTAVSGGGGSSREHGSGCRDERLCLSAASCENLEPDARWKYLCL